MTAAEARRVPVGLDRVLGDPALWLFLGAVVLGGTQTVVLHAGARPLIAALPYAVAAVVVALGQSLRVGLDAARGHRWLVGLGVAQVALALWALQAFLRGLPAGIGESSGFYRVKLLVTTPLGDHNTVAGWLLVGVVATIVLAQQDSRWWWGVAATVAGSVACLSRGAAAVLLLVAIGSWLVGTRRRVALALTAAAVVVLGAVSALAVVLDASPPAGAHVPEGRVGTSVLGRVDLAVRGFEVLADAPALGVGLGGFEDEAVDLPPPNHHAHNALAHAGAEGGVPLLIVTLGVYALLARRGLRQPRGWRREVTLLGGAGLVAHAQLDILSGLLGTEALLAALLALAGSSGRGLSASALGSHRPPARQDRP
ncbi:O-antigen ligase family protein [Nitriliruptor alkaliphilus]|uniref:O-antigen ligase family protein n=1 Tax=Nitriliruptor alkaliphilus TaxID=427918 RepID=UPI000696D52F|nr:O-antigen ligase family protein [Nitriliruptor alkaliphilus]